MFCVKYFMFCFCSIFCKQKHFHVSDFDLWKEHNKRNKQNYSKNQRLLVNFVDENEFNGSAFE